MPQSRTLIFSGAVKEFNDIRLCFIKGAKAKAIDEMNVCILAKNNQHRWTT
jgi:hypothetical protein